jgi:hypothetical protein
LAEIPSFEELEHIAKVLFDSYTSSTAQYESLEDVHDNSSSWATNIPLGSLWDPAAVTTSNIFTPAEMLNAQKQAARVALKKKKQNAKQAKKTKSSDIPDPPFHGDRTFSEAATFKRDAMIAREVASAAAEGDVGRVWEALKVNLS